MVQKEQLKLEEAGLVGALNLYLLSKKITKRCSRDGTGGLLMIIHYLNSRGEETLLKNILCLQNKDNSNFIALTGSGMELTLRVDRIESIIDDSTIVKTEVENGK